VTQLFDNRHQADDDEYFIIKLSGFAFTRQIFLSVFVKTRDYVLGIKSQYVWLVEIMKN
jgi:hypothetical protein